MKLNKNSYWKQFGDHCYCKYQSTKSLIDFCYINSIKLPIIDNDAKVRFMWDDGNRISIEISILYNGDYQYDCNINGLINSSLGQERLPNYIYEYLKQYFKE